MTIRVGINGFGRIGRLVFRRAVSQEGIEVVAINDLIDVDYIAYMLRHDSTHGRFQGTVEVNNGALVVNGKPIRISAQRSPADLRWDEVGVDTVLEATGFFLTDETARQHLQAGAAKVVISAPSKDDTPMFVMGVNHSSYAGQEIVSNASCTTNCLAPVAKVLQELAGIERGYMTTIHSYTGDQPTLDTMHKDLYRARAAAMSMIPTSTGAAKALGLVIPELQGKLDGSSIRVPTPNVSVIDLVWTPGRTLTAKEINDALRAAAEGPLKGVLAVTDEALVSIDFNHVAASSTVALAQTQVIDGGLGRILSWYDNEWGFSSRMSDTAMAMARLI